MPHSVSCFMFTSEPTPEREAALQAGLDALERARLSRSFASQVLKYAYFSRMIKHGWFGVQVMF